MPDPSEAAQKLEEYKDLGRGLHESGQAQRIGPQHQAQQAAADQAAADAEAPMPEQFDPNSLGIVPGAVQNRQVAPPVDRGQQPGFGPEYMAAKAAMGQPLPDGRATGDLNFFEKTMNFLTQDTNLGAGLLGAGLAVASGRNAGRVARRATGYANDRKEQRAKDNALTQKARMAREKLLYGRNRDKVTDWKADYQAKRNDRAVVQDELNADYDGRKNVRAAAMDARTDARYKGEKTASNALDAFNWKGDRLNKSAEAEGRLTGIFDDAAAANTRAQEQAQDEVNRERGGAIATGASAKGIADTITASIREKAKNDRGRALTEQEKKNIASINNEARSAGATNDNGYTDFTNKELFANMHKFIEKTPPRAINLQTGGWTQFPDTGDDEATAPEVAPQPRPTATPQFQTLVEQVQRSEKAVPQLIEILNQERSGRDRHPERHRRRVHRRWGGRGQGGSGRDGRAVPGRQEDTG